MARVEPKSTQIKYKMGVYTMTKTIVSNNDYQEILKNEASIFWSKTFKSSDQGIKGEELEQLKKQYWREMEENLLVYEIEKFNPKLKNKALNNFIEKYCTNNNITDDYTRYTGHLRDDYITIEGCKTRHCTGYNQYLTSDSDLTIIETCEGDLTVITYNTIGAYLEQLEKADKFYQDY